MRVYTRMIAAFADRNYGKIVNSCVIATLLCLALHEKMDENHAPLLLGLMALFASAATVTYFVRLFCDSLVENRDWVAPPVETDLPLHEDIIATNVLRANRGWLWHETVSELSQDLLDVTYASVNVGWSNKALQRVYVNVIGETLEDPETKYARKMAAIVNKLCMNPYGIEYEFYLEPEKGLRIVRAKPHRPEALPDDTPSLAKEPAKHVN